MTYRRITGPGPSGTHHLVHRPVSFDAYRRALSKIKIGHVTGPGTYGTQYLACD
jgi:hypothetical protein